MPKQTIIKLTGIKDSKPAFTIKDKVRGDKLFGSSVPLKVTQIKFGPEEYDGQTSYKLKVRGEVTTSSGQVRSVLVDFGGSGIAKGFANSLLSATSDLEKISFSVWTSKVPKPDGSFGISGGVADMTLPDNGLKGKDNSQALPWAINGDERAALVSKVKLKGKEVTDDTAFCQELTARIEAKYGQTHPFTTTRPDTVDDSLFGDDEEDELTDEDFPTAQNKAKAEDIHIEDIPF